MVNTYTENIVSYISACLNIRFIYKQMPFGQSGVKHYTNYHLQQKDTQFYSVQQLHRKHTHI